MMEKSVKAKKVPAKSSYRYEDDIFSAMPLKREYESSFQKGNIIFDLDKKGKIVGFEILNASRLFGTSKLQLKNYKEIKVKIEADEEMIRINISVKSTIRNATHTNSLSLERVKPDFIGKSKLDLAIA